MTPTPSSPLRPAPGICPPCPWKVVNIPTAVQVQALRFAEIDGRPPTCDSRQQAYAGSVCAAWLAARGADSPLVLAAVTDLRPKRNWPRLRTSVAEVLSAVYETPKIDPVMVALREAREAAGLSQAEVARRLGMMVDTVRDHESGARWPDLARVRSYCDVYRVDLSVVKKR